MKKSLGVKTLACPTPLWVVGTYDSEGRPKGITTAWGGICFSKPLGVNISVRKASFSYRNTGVPPIFLR
jgi:flavin reductase (DIM6/NTAB) family NADH-FMN oxidoreductase RutF